MANRTIPPLDLMFFLTESVQSPKHVGAVQIFELPKNAPDDYLLDIVEKFKRSRVIPPFSYTPHFPRFGMPRWHDGDEIEMDYHVRHSALPRPGNNEQLMEVVQRLHGTLLDRRRPGWICQFIEGLEGNRFAIYSKIHHSYIDGMSGVKRIYGSLSPSPQDNNVTPTWSFDPDKAPRGQARRKKPHNKGNPVAGQAKGLLQAYEFLSKMGLQLLKLRQSEAQAPFAAKRTRMNQPIEWDTRSTAVCTLPLDRIQAIGKAKDCTVNEVVLALIGAALDDYLGQHGEAPEAPLVALCPMSIRSEADASARTQVSAIHVRLGDPGTPLDKRLQQVVDSSHASKAEVSKLSSEAMMDYGVIVFALWELLERSGLDQFVAPSYNVLVSNVPGPPGDDLYLCGSRMIASYPISTLLPGVNLNATVLSHGNSLDFGLLGDRHALPDLQKVVVLMQEHFARLEKSALKKPRKQAKRPARKAVKTRTKSAARPKSRSSTRSRRSSTVAK